MFNFILGLIIGGGVVWFIVKRGMDSRLRGNDRGGEGKTGNPNAEEMERKRQNLEKVIEMVKEKGEIANDDVEHGLGVSDKTAERYLEELVAQGKLTRVGTRGKYVVYKLV